MGNLGFRVYGVGAILLGLVGIAFDDFALDWQPVPLDVPGRAVLAAIVGALLVAGGIAINVKRSQVFGAGLLAILYALDCVLLHVTRIVAHPTHFSTWSHLGEQLALFSGALLAYASFARLGANLAALLRRAGLVAFGLCALMFGVVHFKYLDSTASYVPAWLPPGRVFWAVFTGGAHIAAGLAILSGIRAHLAAILLTLMFIVFHMFVQIPMLMADHTAHVSWAIQGVNISLIGAAWIAADSLRGNAGRWFRSREIAA